MYTIGSIQRVYLISTIYVIANVVFIVGSISALYALDVSSANSKSATLPI
jgi:hypothetical protein